MCSDDLITNDVRGTVLISIFSCGQVSFGTGMMTFHFSTLKELSMYLPGAGLERFRLGLIRRHQILSGATRMNMATLSAITILSCVGSH